MKKPVRALVALQYRVKLIGPDGVVWEWQIKDSYFGKRVKKMCREMLEAIREHDLASEFSLVEPPLVDRLGHLLKLKIDLGEE